MYRLFLIVLIAVSLVSCEKKFTIPLPEEPPRPTLNSFMNQDSVIVVRATLSGRGSYYGGSSSDFTEISNGVIKLYEDGVYLETLQDTVNIYGRTSFKSKAKVKAGKTYKLTLEAPGYDLVEGSDRIPDRGSITVSNKSMFLTPTEYGYNDNNFRFTITNTGTAKCQYRFRMHTGPSFYIDPNTQDTVYTNYTNPITIKTQSSDLSIFGDTYSDPIMGGVYSVQALEPGESKIFTLVAENVEFYNSSFFLEISVLTNDSYNYLYSLNNVLKNGDDPTAERQNVIFNVKNGFGIVGGMAIQETEFK